MFADQILTVLNILWYLNGQINYMTKTIQKMVWIFDINEIQDSKVSGIQIQ